MSLLIIFAQKAEILLTHTMIGNAHSQAISACATHGEQSVIIEQAAKIVDIRYPFCRKRSMEVHQNLSFRRYLLNGTHATSFVSAVMVDTGKHL